MALKGLGAEVYALGHLGSPLGKMARDAAASQSALAVEGIQETISALKDFTQMALYTTTIISKAVAMSILDHAQRHTPYDTGELLYSGFVQSGDAFKQYTHSRMAGRLSPSVSNDVSGIGVFNAIQPELEGSLVIGATGRIGFQRTFTRWVVGFDADHAVIVHENPHDWDFWKSQGKGPYPSDQKTDHFLLNSYDAHRDVFSSAMQIGIQRLIGRTAVLAAASKGKAPTALTSGIGRPILVRR